MRKVELAEIFDATDETIKGTASSAQLNDVVGILAQVRNYQLIDSQGKFGPFTSGGFLARNSWRNQIISEDNVDGTRIFTGQIHKVGQRRDDFGFTTLIEAREALGVLLDFVVDENDVFEQDSITGLTKYKVDGAYPAGHTGPISVTYEDTPSVDVDIPVPSLVSFTDSLIPRYQIVTQVDAGSPKTSTSITLDRALESALVNDQDLRVSTATNRTGPAAIKRALISAGIADRLGSSFDIIDAVDAAAGHTLRMFILSTDNVKLSSHIAKILELTDLYLTYNPRTGLIDIVRGLQWGGQSILETITDDELVSPLELKYDVSNLVFAYDLFYASGSEIGRAQGFVDQELIDLWANSKVWAPVRPGSMSIMGEKYLYTDSTTADFFGERRLEYFGNPRTRISARLKKSVHKNPLETYDIQLLDEFAVTTKTSRNDTFLEEPARIVGFEFSEDAQIYQVTIELTNYLSPNIPRETTIPLEPELV